MTPQLQQAIKLLQMSNAELTGFVESEVEKNPLLKVEATDTAPVEVPSATAETPEGAELVATDSRSDDHTLTAETFDTGTENLHDSSPSDGSSPVGEPEFAQHRLRSGGGHEDLRSLEERLAERPSLRDHLRQQLGQSRINGAISYTARYLIEELDEHGYLRIGLDEIAKRVGVSGDIAAQGLALLQGCSPTGVGARDLAECLALQLREADRLDPAMQKLIDHLGLLERGDLKKLKTLCAVSDEDFSDMLTELRALDPRPCSSFDTVEAETLIPDILLKRTDWGGWHVELNADTLPRLLIDRTYAAEIGQRDCAKTKQYLSECQSNASWLVKSLDQRAKTIVKIASEVVRQQERFFNEGISGLRPLTLRDVADAVGMHESTASRVTANKYIATERGIFELKFFFTNAVGGGDGDITAEAVRHRIKAVVDAEDPAKILSDDTIVDMLQATGIDIARRTVAKYRKSLNIPSSVERRRQKAAQSPH